MDKVEIVPATADLVRAFYGKLPRTMKALVAVVDGRPICVAGTFVNPDGVTVVFADIRDEMRAHKKTGMRMAWRVMAMVRASGVKTFAKADCNIEPAVRFLEHLGFTKRGDVWQA